jgi:hypothetical protein
MFPVCLYLDQVVKAILIVLLGTSFVLEDASRPAEIGATHSRIKYDESGPVKIILVPQPSDDPNDPLVRCLTMFSLS